MISDQLQFFLLFQNFFKKLLCTQLVEYIDNNSIYSNTQSGFRKNHSLTLLLKLKDGIVKAMNKSEVTLAIMADFLKAFDIINYETIIRKFQRIGLSKPAILMLLNYLSAR